MQNWTRSVAYSGPGRWPIVMARLLREPLSHSMCTMADMFLNRPIAIEILWINKDIVSKIDQLMMMANRFFLCVSDTAVSSTSIGRCKIKAKAERTEVEERERQANWQR